MRVIDWIRHTFRTMKEQEKLHDALYGAFDPEVIEAARRQFERHILEHERILMEGWPNLDGSPNPDGRDISDLVDVDEPEQKKLTP